MASSSRGRRLSLRTMEASSVPSSAGRAAAPASHSPSDALGLDVDPLETSKEDLDHDNGKRRHNMSGVDCEPTKRIQQEPGAPRAASMRSTDTLPTAQELVQRGVLVLFKHSGGPVRSGLPYAARRLTYGVLERASDAIKAIKLSHAQQLSAARINKDKALGYLLADMLDEELPSADEAERRGKRVASHIVAESQRIEKDKVRFAEQARALKRSAGDGGLSEFDLGKALADIKSEERAAIERIKDAVYSGWVAPSNPYSRASAQREDDYELTPEEEEEVAEGTADDLSRQAIGVLCAPFHTGSDYAAQVRALPRSILRGHLHVWRATTEANLLAAGLVERALLDELRDRDVDLEYYRQTCALTREVNGGLRRENQLLQAQVRALGGTPLTLNDDKSFADVSIQGLHDSLNGDDE